MEMPERDRPRSTATGRSARQKEIQQNLESRLNANACRSGGSKFSQMSKTSPAAKVAAQQDLWEEIQSERRLDPGILGTVSRRRVSTREDRAGDSTTGDVARNTTSEERPLSQSTKDRAGLLSREQVRDCETEVSICTR